MRAYQITGPNDHSRRIEAEHMIDAINTYCGDYSVTADRIEIAEDIGPVPTEHARPPIIEFEGSHWAIIEGDPQGGLVRDAIIIARVCGSRMAVSQVSDSKGSRSAQAIRIGMHDMVRSQYGAHGLVQGFPDDASTLDVRWDSGCGVLDRGVPVNSLTFVR